MSKVISEKVCVDCKNPFKPNGNRQIRCDNCRTIQKKTYQQKYQKQKQIKVKPVSTEVSNELSKLTVDPETSSEFNLKTDLFGKRKHDDDRSKQFIHEKNQRISIQTFISAGKIVLEDLGINHLEVGGQGLVVSVTRNKYHDGM